MASVNSEPDPRTETQRLLDIALGEERVSLAGLAASEFDKLIHRTLGDLYLEEVRGFKPLGDFLTYQTSDPGGNYDIRSYKPHPAAVVVSEGFEEPVDLRTHVLAASRDLRRMQLTLRRKEADGQESHSLDDIQAWGKTGYLYSVSYETLVLRRPRGHTYGDDNLAVLSYLLTKVPHQDQYLVTEIKVAHLPTEKFRERFGERYPPEAVSMIWELRDACARTLHELTSRAESFAKKVATMERLAHAVSSS